MVCFLTYRQATSFGRVINYSVLTFHEYISLLPRLFGETCLRAEALSAFVATPGLRSHFGEGGSAEAGGWGEG